MSPTIRRLAKLVQKVTAKASTSAAEAKLVQDVVVGIATKSSCHLSEIARATGGSEPLIGTERRLSQGLARKKSRIDDVRYAYLAIIAPALCAMPFVCVDGSDMAKPHGEKFEHLDTISDRSDKHKVIEPGYWLVTIEATDDQHRNLPAWLDVVSTKAPDYVDWWTPYKQAIQEVRKRCSPDATWLFDRGFDDADFMTWLHGVGLNWAVRQKQDRNVVLGDGTVMLMKPLAQSLRTPHKLKIPYVDKCSHKAREWPAKFGYAPVRLPRSDERLFMIVIDCGRKEPIVLLTNANITSKRDAARIALAYIRRWGCEEGLRCWKQMTHVEDLRVRKWESIRRLALLAMMTYGLQALMLLTNPQLAHSYIRRIKVFIQHVLFQHYRLWTGIREALMAGS